MRPLDQQTILLTGATDGLGRARAQDLAARGATVLLHGRSADRLARAAQEIRQATHNDRLRVYRADFASLDAVRGLAREIERDQPRLDVLVNNAGIGGGGRHGRRETSARRHAPRFAGHHPAAFLPTKPPLPPLPRPAAPPIRDVAAGGAGGAAGVRSRGAAAVVAAE